MPERQLVVNTKCKKCGHGSTSLQYPGTKEPFECGSCNEMAAYRTQGQWMGVLVDDSEDWVAITEELVQSPIQASGKTLMEAFVDFMNKLNARYGDST